MKYSRRGRFNKSFYIAVGTVIFLLLAAAGLAQEQWQARQTKEQQDVPADPVLAETPAAGQEDAAESIPSGGLADTDFENVTRYVSTADIDYQVYDLYITVYPTYNEEDQLITRKAFDKHKALDRTYNPVLNCHIWDGSPDDSGHTEGRVGYGDSEINATIRVRGNSSRGDLVKAYKVKLNDRGAEIFGMDTLNLNKHMQDPLRVVNKANMDMMQFIPANFVSLESKFIHLYINDVGVDGSETGFQDQGLYTYVEQPNQDFLVNHGLDPYGALYKPMRFEFLPYENEVRTEDDPLYDQAVFEQVIKPMQNPDHQKVRAMLDAVNDYSCDFQTVMDTYFNEDNYLTWMAINILTGRKDALVHNFLLYSPTNSETWFFLPWDHDESLYYYEVEDWGTMNYQTYGIHYYWTIPLHQRYFRIAGNLDKLTAKIEELMEIVYNDKNISYIEQHSIKVLESFFREGVDAGMFIDQMIQQESSRLDEYLAAENTEEYILAHMTEEINMWYEGIENNYRRYYLSLNNPSPGHIQEPKMEEGQHVFRWDASYDFQGDRVTYDFEIASDYLFQNILLKQTDLSAPIAFVDELPKGHLFYRYVAKDSAGNIQYPLNLLDLRTWDDKPIIWAYGMGYLNNGAVGDYDPYADYRATEEVDQGLTENEAGIDFAGVVDQP